jgi:hypothetical protein
MALRNGHGTGAGVPRIEVLPADEQPDPIPATVAVTVAAVERRENGTLGADLAKLLGSLGGRAKAAAMVPYVEIATRFVEQHLPALAAQAGGEVGPGPSSVVTSAALQLGASRWAFDRATKKRCTIKMRTELLKLSSQLANDSRQNLLAAYELAVREAKARSLAPLDASDPLKATGSGGLEIAPDDGSEGDDVDAIDTEGTSS